MKPSDFTFHLPPELIATVPSPRRDGSRLLVVDRKTGKMDHALFKDLGQWIHSDDLLILNNSRVIPAALSANRGSVVLLLLEETSPHHWLAIGKPGKLMKAGMSLTLDKPAGGNAPDIELHILSTLEDGSRVLRATPGFDPTVYGTIPLPPYILQARKNSGMPLLLDEERHCYQTVYAADAGSVAAPTAGLHFTQDLLARFEHGFVTLHVGLGTFRPVKASHIEDHKMHEERFSIPDGLAERASKAKRVVAVGTTSARVLETVPDLKPCSGRTSIFIHPPYRFKRVDGLITNFHLPGSTLVMLVAAFMGHELQQEAYRQAIANGYRFYSYGDAMLIL